VSGHPPPPCTLLQRLGCRSGTRLPANHRRPSEASSRDRDRRRHELFWPNKSETPSDACSVRRRGQVRQGGPLSQFHREARKIRRASKMAHSGALSSFIVPFLCCTRLYQNVKYMRLPTISSAGCRVWNAASCMSE
jgi:hypothetical protein